MIIVRSLTKTVEQQHGGALRRQLVESTAIEVFKVISASVAWAFKNLDALEPPRAKKKKRGVAARSGGVGQTVGEHTVAPRPGGGVQCVVCQLCSWSAAGKRWLRQKPCRGELASQVHPSHVLRRTGGMVWCSACGAYTSRMPRRLLAPCCGGPRSEAQQNVRRRLLAGLPPTTSALHKAVVSARGGEAAELTSYHHPLCHGDRIHIRPYPAALHDAYVSDGPDGGEADDAGAGAGLRAVPPTYYAQLEIRRRRRAVSADGARPPHSSPEVHAPAREAREPGTGSSAAASNSSYSCMPTVPKVNFRVTGKQPQRTSSQENLMALTVKFCKPSAASSWSVRIRAAAICASASCHLCMGPTRTICRGCQRRVCLECARGRWHCAA